MRDSRRARLVLALLVLTAITLVTLDYRDNSFHGVRTVAADVFGPIERALSDVFRPIGRFFSDVAHSGSYAARVSSLQQEIDRLRTELRSGDNVRHELAEMQGLYRFSSVYRIVPAQVTAIGNGLGYGWTVTIDAGRDSGIAPNMTVIDSAGLVGRVRSVTGTSAIVLLIIDPASTVFARLAGSGEAGYTTGDGLRPLVLSLLNPQANVHTGDGVVSLGPDLPYVAGVPIGTVIRVEGTAGGLTKTALVQPYVDFTTLDVLGVIVAKPRVNPGFRLLPHPAARSPSATPSASPSPTTSPSPGG
jgi:rod shape-determining protein MreC